MPEYPWYVWICLNICEYAYIYLNDSFNISLFPYLVYNLFSTWTRDYVFKILQETRGYNLKEHEAVFLKRQNLIFSIAAGDI